MVNATKDIIVTTDAGCTLGSHWLQRITEPLLSDPSIDVVGGWYRADARSFIERSIASVWLLSSESVSVDNFIPSSRPFAFRKTAWSRVGGYPENYYV